MKTLSCGCVLTDDGSWDSSGCRHSVAYLGAELDQLREENKQLRLELEMAVAKLKRIRQDSLKALNELYGPLPEEE